MTLEEYVDLIDEASRRDPLLTVSLRRLLTAVAFRATEGWTIPQLLGWLAYRKQAAQTPQERAEAERALRALKTDRWGIRRFVNETLEELRQQAKREAELLAEMEAEREARVTPRQLYYEEVRDRTRQLPPGRRSSGRSRGRKKVVGPLHPTAKARADIMRKLIRASRRKRSGSSAT